MTGRAIRRNCENRAARLSDRRHAHGTTVKRSARPVLATICVLALSMTLGACSGFSGYVADHWPRWAGGMPDDVPPRPGAPGYDEFIAHGGADRITAGADAAVAGANAGAAKPAAAASAPKTAATAAEPVFQQTPAAPPAPANDQPAQDQSVVKGGLY